jgi:hypothetical protein
MLLLSHDVSAISRSTNAEERAPWDYEGWPKADEPGTELASSDVRDGTLRTGSGSIPFGFQMMSGTRSLMDKRIRVLT